MSKHYVYSGDQAIIIPDGTILWNDESNDQSTLHYFDANDSTINENYVTAIDSNETQYLSILEASNTNGISLEDLHLTVEHEDESIGITNDNPVEKNCTEQIQQNDPDDNAEVVVFTMDGSDDLYGIQMTCDETGNIRKYQFKFRATSDGQLEPIPETVTLLPDEDQLLQSQSGEIEQTDQSQSTERAQEYFLVPGQSDCSEKILTENGQVEELNLQHVYIEETCLPNDQLNTVSIKGEHFLGMESEGQFEQALFDQTIHSSIICKEENQIDSHSSNALQLYQQEAETSNQFGAPEENQEQQFLNIDSQQTHEDLVQQLFCGQHNQIEVQYETELEPEDSPTECEYSEAYENHENPMDYAVEYIQQAADNLSQNCDTEQYTQRHIENYESAEGEVPIETNTVPRHLDQISQHSSVQRSNILKNPVTSDKENKSKLRYYVVYREKENMNSLAEEKTKSVSQVPTEPKLTKLANPRSVLRTSVLAQKEHRLKRNTTSSVPETDLFDKRFARNKDALRAKHFHNFLNKTTIPHAPIRQHRQPRKQEIKPIVERSRGEIIIQEVIVSSSGFVERPNKRTCENRVTAIVELSDSEDEAASGRRKSRRSWRTSESDKSVILIHSDDELDDSKTSTADKAKLSLKRSRSQRTPIKRKRKGKHRKIDRKVADPSSKDLANIDKVSQESTQLPQCDNRLLPIYLIDLHKKEKICPHCPKTFPSQNSLNTHLIHHNLENSLKNKTRLSSKPNCISTRQSLLRKVEYNHKCDKCKSTFKNIILLQKHKCIESQGSFNCLWCLKQFDDIVLLNSHKKVHVKSNLVKNTSIITITPKKAVQRPSVSKSNVVIPSKNLASKTFKCKDCPRICDSIISLFNHMKVHKKVSCSSCLAEFSSKLLLEHHRRRNCVKIKPIHKPLLVGNSNARPPTKQLTVSSPTNKTENDTLKEPLVSGKLNCYKCNRKFSTVRNLYVHRSQAHRLNTPSKTVLTKLKNGVYKSKAAHGGIPLNDRLKMACATFRKKLSETVLTVE
ncbi:uncharacterized protein LOC109546979 isoform X2 [Dendroctonus ponderosae]|uniref:uncharacterized protein LOC109546979 isoform X2 n=1 Tax=Dendroctonus ponderosae TaxID=77166 RepID=UPI0020353B4C|nr:uncharacterized protein LOC109546979 isoform X2 [Dendroctonus ponderosae]